MRLQPAEVFQTTLTTAAGLSGAADTATKFVNMVDRLSPGFAACGIGLALASPGVPIAIGAVLTTLNLWQQSRQNREAADLQAAIDAILQELRARPDAKDLIPTDLETAIRAMLNEQNDLLVQGFREDLADSTARIADLHAEVQTLITSLEAFQAQYTLEVQKESGARLDLELPKAKLDAQGYLYYQAATRLTGRENDLKSLQTHLTSEHPFLFFIVSGPGGVGKSRLAWELCWRMRRQGWEAGFVKSLTEGTFNWGAWRPERDTLLVVDYIFAKDKDLWRKILDKLAAREEGRRLRILVLERTSDASSWDWLAGDGELGRHYGPADAEQPWRRRDDTTGILKLETHEVKGLDQAGIEAIFWDYKVPDHEARAARYLKEIDPIGRPLFAMLAARSLNELGADFKWSLGELLDHVLHRLCKTWRDAGVDTPHLRLLVLATMLGGLHPEEFGAGHPLADLLPSPIRDEILVQLASFSDDWDPERRWLPPLLPDPLGEAFVLAYFLGQFVLFGEASEVAAKANADRLMVHAEANGGEPYTDFKRRALQDFPASFKELRPLNFLDLSDSDLAPESIAALTELQWLVKLDLRSSELRSEIVMALGKITSLKELSLSACEIDKDMFEALCRLPNLEGLNLYDAEFAESWLFILARSKNLTSLNLGDTGLGSSVFKHLAKITTLQTVSLGRNNIKISHSTPLRYLEGLKALHLPITRVKDSCLEHISTVTGLTCLDLEFNDIRGEGLYHLKNLPLLTDLRLGGTKVCDKGLTHLGGIASLSNLSLWGTRVASEGLAHLSELTSLKTLDLAGTHVSGAGLAHLSGLTSLTTLNLMSTQVGDAGLAHLSGLTSLTKLDLAETKVGDAGLAHLSGLTSLSTLDLRYTKVTPEGRAWLQERLANCEIHY